MNFFHVYITTDCDYCEKALDILDEYGKLFVVTVLDSAPPVLEAIKRQFEHQTVPIVLEMYGQNQGRKIGGFHELEKYLGPRDAKYKSLSEMTPEERQEDEDYWNHGQGD